MTIRALFAFVNPSARMRFPVSLLFHTVASVASSHVVVVRLFPPSSKADGFTFIVFMRQAASVAVQLLILIWTL